MKQRNKRLETIKMLISRQDFSSHDDIVKALSATGFEITQATLSRDLKMLKVAKAARPDGRYVYVLPNEAMYRRVSESEQPVSLGGEGQGILSLRFSQNLGVIKTRNGYASALAYDIDQAEIPEVLGTIAGGDTIFLVLAERASYVKVTDELKRLFDPGGIILGNAGIGGL